MTDAVDSIHSNNPSPAGPGEPESIQGTIIDFGDFKVRQQRRGTQVIFQFSGLAGNSLCHEIERLVGRCRGDVGIDFSEIEGFTPALVPALERARKRLYQFRRSLFLCNPPSKLLDALELSGLKGLYHVVGSGSRQKLLAEEVEDGAAPVEKLRNEAAQIASEKARKEIARFDISLKRTERLEQNLDSAARCVRKMLPHREPSVPGYRFAVAYRQSEIIGGDFFDFIPLGTGRLGFSIGDVSGNGLEAAILMCLSKKVIAIHAGDRARDPTTGRSPAPEAPSGKPGPASPREVLSRANEDLRSDMDRKSFVTALYGILESSTGTFTFARAGHERPILFSPGSGKEPRTLPSNGVALGILPGAPFRAKIQEQNVEIRPGEFLLLYTDGLVEAHGPRGQMFSRKRLLEELRNVRPGLEAREILGSLLDAIRRHAGGGPPQDDITALLIAREPTGVAQG